LWLGEAITSEMSDVLASGYIACMQKSAQHEWATCDDSTETETIEIRSAEKGSGYRFTTMQHARSIYVQYLYITMTNLTVLTL
jgi:hypothetical protein